MALPLTFDQMVYLCQSDAVMVNFTVFEQTPKLQTRQQGGVGMTESAVEAIDRPQFCVLPKHHKLHLLHESQLQCTNGSENEGELKLIVENFMENWDLTCFRSVFLFFSGILSRRHSMFRATSSVDESLSDRGDATMIKHQRISKCNTVHFIGNSRISSLNGANLL